MNVVKKQTEFFLGKKNVIVTRSSYSLRLLPHQLDSTFLFFFVFLVGINRKKSTTGTHRLVKLKIPRALPCETASACARWQHSSITNTVEAT